MTCSGVRYTGIEVVVWVTYNITDKHSARSRLRHSSCGAVARRAGPFIVEDVV